MSSSVVFSLKISFRSLATPTQRETHFLRDIPLTYITLPHLLLFFYRRRQSFAFLFILFFTEKVSEGDAPRVICLHSKIQRCFRGSFSLWICAWAVLFCVGASLRFFTAYKLHLSGFPCNMWISMYWCLWICVFFSLSM